MNVGQLKAIVANMPDDAGVIIELPEQIRPDVVGDYLRHVVTARDSKVTSISGHNLTIVAGEFFGW